MSSVTKRISEIKQPRGGYVKPSQFEIHKIDDGHILSETENIHASVVGMAVDYLTRFAMGSELLEAFKISCITFEPNGYTETVNSGDGDYLTADTLWDFKVSKSKPTNKHTLQLLMYWIMGQHSGQKIYKSIQNLGIFNPRLNEVYLLNVNTISKEIITEVERDVICY